MASSLCSLIGSATIIAMVIRSKKKFGDPYRRLIVGISFFDCLQSFALLFKIFKTTPEQPNSWISLGNQTSCNILGWLHFCGLNGALLYNVALNIYYLCLVRYNLTSRYYQSRVEPFLHAIPIIWSALAPSIIVGTGHMNPAFAGECLIAPYPVNCRKKPGVECIRGENTDLYRFAFRVIPTFAALVGCLFTLGLLWWTVNAQEKKMNRYRMSMVSSRLRSSIGTRSAASEEDILTGWKKVVADSRNIFKTLKRRFLKTDEGTGGAIQNISITEGTRRRQRSQYRRGRSGRAFLAQARWYVVAFVATHMCPIAVVIMELGGDKPKLWVLIIGKFLVPLQGLFNILVYTRPHVMRLREKKTQLSYWAALMEVISSGGDDDNTKKRGLRRGSMDTRRSLTNLRKSFRSSDKSNSRTSQRKSDSSSSLLAPPVGMSFDYDEENRKSVRSVQRSPSGPPPTLLGQRRKSRVSFKLNDIEVNNDESDIPPSRVVEGAVRDEEEQELETCQEDADHLKESLDQGPPTEKDMASQKNSSTLHTVEVVSKPSSSQSTRESKDKTSVEETEVPETRKSLSAQAISSTDPTEEAESKSSSLQNVHESEEIVEKV